jgi:hypothetical protein
VLKRRNFCKGAAGRWRAHARRPRADPGPARLASVAVASTVLTLAAQHGLLLLQRLSDGSLFDPAVLGRWVVGLLLAGVLLALRRAGVSLVRGREAAVFWLAVVALHAAAAAPVGDATALALQPGAIVPVLLALSALWLGAPSRVTRPAPARSPSSRPATAAFLGGVALPFSARPPPAVAA